MCEFLVVGLRGEEPLRGARLVEVHKRATPTIDLDEPNDLAERQCGAGHRRR
jgi:hypothetical protein